MVAGLAVSGAPARAATAHDYLSRLTEVPFGAPVSGSFSEPAGLAVDSGGDVYVGDPGNGVIDEFGPPSELSFVSQLLAPEVEGARAEPGGSVAVNDATGEAYAADSETGVVYVFGIAGELLSSWDGKGTPGRSFGVEGVNVAVDNSTSASDPAAGDVFVSDREHAAVELLRPEADGKETYLARLTKAPKADGGRFEEPGAVAVDQANGDLLVAVHAKTGSEEGKEVVDVFEPEAVLGEYRFLAQLTGPPGGEFDEVAGVAVDGTDGDIYVSDEQAKVVDEFTSAGAYLTRLSGTPRATFASPKGVAVGPTGDVYVADSGKDTQEVDVFGPNVVVPDVTTGPVSDLQAASATVNGTVDADGEGDAACRVEYGTSGSYGQSAVCSPASLSGESPVAVSANLSGLSPGTLYHYRLEAINANGTSSTEGEFTTPGPQIHGESAVQIGSSAATLQAQIDPADTATSYYFQYGTSSAYGTSVPAPPGTPIGSGEADVGVSVPLEGLQPDTTYHYRVVAVSAVATVEGADQTFTTQLAVAGALPDGRDWELVSPPDKNGGMIGALEYEGGVAQASEDGGAITYGVSAPVGSDPAGNPSPEWSQVLSVRGAGGWSSQDIAVPKETDTGVHVGNLSTYELFSSDLSLALVEPHPAEPGDEALLSPKASEYTIYLRADPGVEPEASLSSVYDEAQEGGGYLPLVTAANVPPGTKFGQGTIGERLKIEFVSATPDLSHVLFSSPEALTSNAVKNGDERSLYEWAGGALQLVSVLPDGKPASEEATTTGNKQEPRVGYESEDMRDAVSDSGTRVFWTSGLYGDRHLYMRDMASGETIQVDTPEHGVTPGAGEPHFQTASSDGSRVFFTDQARLTKDSTASSVEKKADLYECEVVEAAGKLACKLSDLTVDPNPEESAGVQSLVLGASEDGSYVYFVATGLLSTIANSRGERAVPGSFNLYVAHYEGGEWATRFIAGLSREDERDFGDEEIEGPKGERNLSSDANLVQLTARVSPDGRYMAFMSDSSLTGYDNVDANSAQRDEEVFLYAASAARLTCASCNPTGARPVGVYDESREVGQGQGLLVDEAQSWTHRWLAASIPGWTAVQAGVPYSFYQSRYLSDDGRLFFDSADALVSGVTAPTREEKIGGQEAVVGVENVYEYEPPGIGSCTSSSAGFIEASAGCVGLISSGTSHEESVFLDASASGSDVFFVTAAQLAAQDHDTALDVYDAHECTAASPCLAAPVEPPQPCGSGESCRPGSSPQPTGPGALGSAAFSGAGNLASPAQSGVLPSITVKPKPPTRAQKLAKALKACRKDKRKSKRAACEKLARKRYGAKPKPEAKKKSTSAETSAKGSGQ
jgi:hypothetical protein